MALTALAMHASGTSARRRKALLLLGVFGAALFYGDSVITPAISVLGAAEGLEVASPALKTWVVPISVGILIGLFVVQRHGTRRVGSAFGPIILLWFAVLAATGIWQIVQEPTILQALDPRRAFDFLRERGWHVFAAVGAIVLALTGAEALYADMGHFGRRPIQIAWTGIVLPALALNYMGQGALLMRDPGALDNPFFRLFSSAWLMPALALATCAAVIASQAVISGAYSMTRQAIQLGVLPRMRVEFTSASQSGQIYMPAVNRGASCRRRRRGARLRQLVGARRRVRHRRHRDDADHDRAHLLRGSPRLGLSAAGRARRHRPVRGLRRPARRLVRGQVPRRRLVPARHGRGDLHRHGDVEARPRAAARAPP
jgi:KUP system potassium uptake protein